MPLELTGDPWKDDLMTRLNEAGHYPDPTGRYCIANGKPWPCVFAREMVEAARDKEWREKLACAS